jgi:hypothetical protein
MGLSNGPAGNPAESPRSVDDAEPSPVAPHWAHDHARPRKVVPLRIPSAPQLVPAAHGEAPAQAVAAASSRPPNTSTASRMGPELLAQDEVLKRLLESAPADRRPPPVQPVRDPVGLALGMVARWIVAASAAAGIAMLLFGVVPLPFRAGPSTIVESPTGGIAQPATVQTERVIKSDQGVVGGQIVGQIGDQGADQVADAPASPNARVATLSPRAAASSDLALEVGEVERLVKRGEEFLARGDIAAARLVLGRAAGAHDARATYVLAQTFDPDVLRRLHVVGFQPDLGKARDWYEKAAGYGSGDAAGRLNALPRAATPLN